MVGEGWDVINEKWSPFKINIQNGEAIGGGYDVALDLPKSFFAKVKAFLRIK